ncbi:3-hydroxyacyl-[acyl-carrier-protein] dehydratase [Phycisphaerales bacterium]|nr:3-hydroxyacyl-[acyl-carrier-protein] dehydratase [Phycisphaerales bacterium]
MRFSFVDRVLEQSPDRIVTLKQVTSAEEYLQDHFPTFPVLPGVFMLESMVQAARLVAEARGLPRLVLGKVRALKYGRFVKPGATLRVEVSLAKTLDDGSLDFKGEALLLEPGTSIAEPPVAVSGRFLLRPIRPCRDFAALPPQ